MEGDESDWKKVRRGWMLGSEEFRKELLVRMQEKVGLSHYGVELRESDEEKARRIMVEESRKLKLKKTDFKDLRKSDPWKVEV